MNSIYFSLSQKIELNKFVKLIQDLISKHENVSDKILKVEILKISKDYNDILKLENKNA